MIYETETESWTYRTGGCHRGGGWGRDGGWSQQMYAFIHRMNKQLGSTLQRKELYSISFDKL